MLAAGATLALALPAERQRAVECPRAEWDEELVGALTAAADAKNAEEARQQIPQLLGKLGDPFTRWLAAK